MRCDLVKITLFFLLSGCAGQQSQPQIAAETPKCTPDNKGSKNKNINLADPVEQVTFYGDLLPILSSVESDKIYKCTTCHAEMAKPDGLNTVDKLNRAVEAMENGRMPRPGNSVPKDKIELFRIWQLQGFQEGDKNAKPVKQQTSTSTSTSDETSTGSGTSGNCP